LSDFANPKPRLGLGCLDRDGLWDLQRLIEDLAPEVIAVSHSYLAPLVRRLVPEGTVFVVDFANVEGQRLRSLSRAGRWRNRMSARWESTKAGWWEPRVAREADVCLAVDQVDQTTLAAWGARRTHVVPNSVDGVAPYRPSPADGPALFLASGYYGPNQVGARWLFDDVWPRVRRQLPEAELWVAGWGTESAYRDIPGLGIKVVGGVHDLSALAAGSAVCVAPVTSGAGTQLKVLEVLARHRTVVATPFSARSIPERAVTYCDIQGTCEGFSDAVVRALANTGERHAREALVARWVPLWRDSVRPLAELLTTGEPILAESSSAMR
jgi:hypothetical protein